MKLPILCVYETQQTQFIHYSLAQKHSINCNSVLLTVVPILCALNATAVTKLHLTTD